MPRDSSLTPLSRHQEQCLSDPIIGHYLKSKGSLSHGWGPLQSLSPSTHKSRLEKLKTYIKHNAVKIIDYRERQKNGLVFTSNLAESTVESLINQRCKGQQHMRRSREGLEPLLQLRAAIGSNDWDKIWKTAVMNAIIAQKKHL